MLREKVEAMFYLLLVTLRPRQGGPAVQSQMNGAVSLIMQFQSGCSLWTALQVQLASLLKSWCDNLCADLWDLCCSLGPGAWVAVKEFTVNCHIPKSS